VYTVSPLESLFSEERRCPRCGVTMTTDLRERERRELVRRVNADTEPGPPDGDERRVADRRTTQRRRPTNTGGR
jgi:hypothetical protein